MNPFSIEEVEDPRGLILCVGGFMDIDSAAKFDKHLATVLHKRPALVVFDLSNAPYISSPCIGALVKFRQNLHDHGGEVKLAAAHPSLAETFRRVGLTQVFLMFDTVEQALSR
ncbi:hypothetical protein BH10PLA1_BH10PLA1_21430 [soil metagenome]